MRGAHYWVGLLTAAAVAAPSAAGASEGGPLSPDCDPFGLAGPETAGDARISEQAFEAGVVEPNVDEAYEDALESGLENATEPAGRRARATGPVRAPVYVHVIQDGPGVGVIPAPRIESQIGVLNTAFGGGTGGDNTGVVFELVDTDVTINPAWSPLEVDTSEEAAMKAALHEGGARALNLYIVDLSTLLGWATFPEDYAGAPVIDGVVVENDSLPGGPAPYGEGDTATHEVGHWLGLFHTFQGGCGPSGDFVDDTEPENGPHFGCPVINSCPGGANDPVDNFMSYSDDACMHRFTAGQGNRMNDQTAAFRNGAPTGAAQSASTSGETVAVNIAATDPDGDALSYAVTDAPGHGTLGGTGAALTYTPDKNYAGPDSFTVSATDVFGATARVPVSISVGGLKLKAKAKQRLSKLSVTGSCGSGACDLTATGRIVTNGSGGNRAARASRTFKLKKASAKAKPNESAKLRLKLAKPKQRRLLELLKSGWKATAKVSVAAEGSGGASRQRVSITVKP